MNIFELTGIWREALDALQDPDVPQSEALERLRAVSEDIDRKADGYGKLIRSLEAEADGLKNEASRLNARAKTFENPPGDADGSDEGPGEDEAADHALHVLHQPDASGGASDRSGRRAERGLHQGAKDG